jgi:hypothetical protein
VQDDPFEMSAQARAPQQVAGDYRPQAHAQAPGVVVGELAVALHHQDVQPVVRVGEDLPVAALQQVVEHALAAAADVGRRDPFGKVLFGIQLTEAADASYRVVKAGTGEAPGADRGTDQCPLAGYRWQPLSEQCQVQALYAQGLRPAGRTRQYTHIRSLQAALADLPQRTLASLEGEGGMLDMNGAHGDLGAGNRVIIRADHDGRLRYHGASCFQVELRTAG